MSEIGTVKAALEAAASNPKVASIVAVTTTSLGAASTMEMLQGWLGIASLAIGCLVGLFVIRIHIIKYRLLLRAWENGESSNEGGD